MTNMVNNGFNQLAFDLSGINSLKRQVASASAAGTAQVAKQFESLFISMMMKSMRQSVPNGGLLDSSSLQLVTSMFDQQIAQQASGKGFGLAEMLTKQLMTTSQSTLATRVDGQTASQVTAMSTSSQQSQYLAQSLFADSSSGMTPKALGQMLYQNQKQQPVDNTVPGRAALKPTDAMPADPMTQFVADWLAPARYAAKKSGIPYEIIIAQAALETGWGQRQIKTDEGQQSFNYFGIKAGSTWQGKTTQRMTTEYINQQPISASDHFRVYNNHYEALDDYTKLLTQNQRYQKVVAATDAKQAAVALQDCNYATDPNYADKLIQVIDRIRAITPYLAMPLNQGIRRLSFNNSFIR